MRADDTNVVPEGARGRDSIRIQSNASHENAVVVLDISHMPAGMRLLQDYDLKQKSTYPSFQDAPPGLHFGQSAVQVHGLMEAK